MDGVTVSAAEGSVEDMEGICVMPDLSAIKTEQSVGAAPDDTNPQNVAMGIKFILPNRFDMNVCSRFVKSLNEEDSKNIQDQVNSDLEVASVLFKAECNIQYFSFSWYSSASCLHTVHHKAFFSHQTVHHTHQQTPRQ
ncbi:Ankyrin repeat family A protein 2 [Oryzias melastigma]|uniref:Ankyrin repeat family A protein 2 n=1 Tax=Oryzias melastigma TaxID=30732 RepID=A0A834FJ63_ORYME|nr:Ankyrin repeat family A protein 2 [Oryzias melastigma]